MTETERAPLAEDTVDNYAPKEESQAVQNDPPVLPGSYPVPAAGDPQSSAETETGDSAD